MIKRLCRKLLYMYNLEALEEDLNGTMRNYLRLSLLVLTYFLHFTSPEYVNMIKRLENCYV